MVKRTYTTDDNEPTESQFKLPSPTEHLFQVVDVNPAITPSGEDENIQVVKLEIIGGEDNGSSILLRVNLNENEKSFYFSRLFLKAIGESYKGVIEIDTDRWVGRQFYATIKHTESKGKTYANIYQYNFDKKIELQLKPSTQHTAEPSEIQWEN